MLRFLPILTKCDANKPLEEEDSKLHVRDSGKERLDREFVVTLSLWEGDASVSRKPHTTFSRLYQLLLRRSLYNNFN